MTPQIAQQIQAQQNYGRAKWGDGPDDFRHDDAHTDEEWACFMDEHSKRAYNAGSDRALRRSHLIKLAGLAVSAVEALDRQPECDIPEEESLRPERPDLPDDYRQ